MSRQHGWQHWSLSKHQRPLKVPFHFGSWHREHLNVSSPRGYWLVLKDLPPKNKIQGLSATKQDISFAVFSLWGRGRGSIKKWSILSSNESQGFAQFKCLWCCETRRKFNLSHQQANTYWQHRPGFEQSAGEKLKTRQRIPAEEKWLERIRTESGIYLYMICWPKKMDVFGRPDSILE